jgi:hypothetical protein
MGKRVRALILSLALLGIAVLLGSAALQWIRSPEPGTEEEFRARQEGRIRVEILNAGGIPGLARNATSALREAGFDVVYFGNAGTFSEEESVVMDRVGRMDLAEAVADALGILKVESAPDSTRYLEITVRLGPEWPSADPWTSEEDSVTSWWESRRVREEPDTLQRVSYRSGDAPVRGRTAPMRHPSRAID